MSLIATFLATAMATAPTPLDPRPAQLDLSRVRAIPVQHDGRWMPLDTLARDTVETVTSGRVFADRDPVSLLLAWTFDPATWKDVPLISIPHRQLRQILGLPVDQTVYSYIQLVDHEPLNRHLEHLSGTQGRRPDPLETKVRQIGRKLVVLDRVFQGRVIRPIPDPQDALGAWQPILVLSEGLKGRTQGPAQAEWIELGKAFLAEDGPAFAAATDRLIAALAALPAAHRPDPARIVAELRYNRFNFFRLAWQIMLAGAVLAAAGMIVRRTWLDVLTLAGLVAGFGTLTYGLSLRWQIAGHIPAANMFESLLFLSWGLGLFAIGSRVFGSSRLAPLTAAALGAVALLLADCLPLDHYIRPVAPILLDTIWMSIHVPVIMVSYSVLALAVVIAHVQLVAAAVVPSRGGFLRTIDSLHAGYVSAGTFLLLIGIVTGSMWAASSWGRYWGWDPKEVWSLVALLGYLALLHVRIDTARVSPAALIVAAILATALFGIIAYRLAPLTGIRLLALTAAASAMGVFLLGRGPFATAVKSILAFWLIIMTYVGVNFVLGTGLHTYAFGTGAVVHYLFLIGGIDLLLVGICGGAYLLRGSGR